MICIIYDKVSDNALFILYTSALYLLMQLKELCTLHLKPYWKTDAVASCLKCSELSPSQESPRVPLYWPAFRMAPWGGLDLSVLPWIRVASTVSPGDPLRRTVLDYSSILELNYWESGWVNLNCTHTGWLPPLCVFFHFFVLSCQSRNKSNRMRIAFYLLLVW